MFTYALVKLTITKEPFAPYLRPNRSDDCKMKVLDLAARACVLGIAFSTAIHAQEGRFLEIPGPGGQTVSFDLSTVKLVAPSRFYIQSLSLDDVNVMKFKLKALAAEDELCKSGTTGKYQPPQTVFTLGRPDLPISPFEVTERGGVKFVQWSFPYTKLSTGSQQSISFLRCTSSDYIDSLRSITNGYPQRYLFDCKRGLEGTFLFSDTKDSSQALTTFVKEDTYAGRYYSLACLAVTKENPYFAK